MREQTLIFIDPGFQVNFGHYMKMGEAIRKESRALNIELQHFVNLNVSQEKADELNLIRSFKYTAGLPWLEESGEALRDFHIKLDQILYALVKREKQNDYEVFMYTAHPLHLPVIAFLINKYSVKINNLSAHVYIFYIDPEFCTGSSKADEYISMLKILSRLIELFDPNRLMTICTDSERAAQLYGPYFEREIKILPVPIEVACKVPMDEQEVVKDRITIGYIGQTTKRAGYHLVYQAYKRIATTEIFNKVTFKIKHTLRVNTSDIYNKFAAESNNVIHINEFLSNEAYEKFLSSLDIILIPYSKKYYPCQTSGLVTEALLRKKVVIVPEDTWMSDQIRDYGSGETFISDNSESFVQAVVKAVTNFEYYKERTGNRINEYRNIHSCTNLFSEIGLKDTEVNVNIITDSVNMDSIIEAFEETMLETILLLQEKNSLVKQIEQKDRLIKNRDDMIKNRDDMIKNRNDMIHMLQKSFSWKITAPFRGVSKLIQSTKRGEDSK